MPEIIAEKKGKKKGAKKPAKTEQPEKQPVGYYSPEFDFSQPLGRSNLYKIQGASNWGPATATIGGWPSDEVDESVFREIGQMVEADTKIVESSKTIWSALDTSRPVGLWEQARRLAEASDDVPDVPPDEVPTGDVPSKPRSSKKCECENENCDHVGKLGACQSAIGSAKTMHGSCLCDHCATRMPKKYLLPPRGTAVSIGGADSDVAQKTEGRNDPIDQGYEDYKRQKAGGSSHPVGQTPPKPLNYDYSHQPRRDVPGMRSNSSTWDQDQKSLKHWTQR